LNENSDTPPPITTQDRDGSEAVPKRVLRAKLRIEDLDRDEVETLIVRAVLAGRSPASRLVEAYVSIIFSEASGDAVAMAVPRYRVPDRIDPDLVFLLGAHCTPARIAELEAGATASGLEHAAWRAAWLERALDNHDADVTAAVCITSLNALDGRGCVAMVTITGYSFSGITREWHGFFGSKDDALAALRCTHYLSCDPLPGAPILCGEGEQGERDPEEPGLSGGAMIPAGERGRPSRSTKLRLVDP
jgi:hypothetical protein